MCALGFVPHFFKSCLRNKRIDLGVDMFPCLHTIASKIAKMYYATQEEQLQWNLILMQLASWVPLQPVTQHASHQRSIVMPVTTRHSLPDTPLLLSVPWPKISIYRHRSFHSGGRLAENTLFGVKVNVSTYRHHNNNIRYVVFVCGYFKCVLFVSQ